MIEVTTACEFFSDPRRRKSPELDFGVIWTLGTPWPRWRVSWIDDTGELYAIPMTSPPDPDVRPVLILGVFRTRHEVERRMRGWSDKLRRDLSEYFPELRDPKTYLRVKRRVELALQYVGAV